MIGPYADIVALDWYSGTPGYSVSAIDGIKNKLGGGVKVEFAHDNTDGAAIKIARGADVAIVIVGNHPTCNSGWANARCRATARKRLIVPPSPWSRRNS